MDRKRGTVLVTGASGFLGSRAIALLIQRGYPVVATGRKPTRSTGVLFVRGDLRDERFTQRLVDEVRPTHVLHVAGLVGDYTRSEFFDIHAIATGALLDAVAATVPDAWVGVASSSAVYGRSASQPVAETHPLLPLTDYASSKVAGEAVVTRMRLGAGLRCFSLRFFNIFGPGQSVATMPAALARQMAVAERSRPPRPSISVGNLTPRRDLIDVDDAAEGLIGLMEAEAGEPAVNIGTGVSHSMQECLDELLANARCEVRVVADEARMRAVEIPDQRADISLLRSLTNFEPRVAFGTSVRLTLDHFRDEAAVRAMA